MDVFDEIHEKTQKDENPTHDFGDVTGFEEKSGLPIVRRKASVTPDPEGKMPAGGTNGTKPEPADARSDRNTGGVDSGESGSPENGDRGNDGGGPPEAAGAARPVIQPSDDPAANQALATAGLKEILPALKKIIASVSGANLAGVRAEKDPERTQEKIQKEGKPASTLPDYGALRISVDSLEDNDKLVAAIKQQFPIAKEKNEIEQGDPEQSFHAMMLQVEAPNGATIECQILPKEQADIAESSHPDYAKARDGDKGAKASLKQQNDAAMVKFNERNTKGGDGRLNKPSDGISRNGRSSDSGRSENATSKVPAIKPVVGVPSDAGNDATPNKPVSEPKPFTKGQHVALPDGRSGSVDYHDAKVTGNARVTADDGERIQSIPGKNLTAVTPKDAPQGGKYLGVDLDGTLARSGPGGPRGAIGKPVPAMVEKVRQALAAGKDVRIYTARVANDPDGKATRAIQAWSQKNLGEALPVTDIKEPGMEELLDDKAVHVGKNTGKVDAAEEKAVKPPAGHVAVAAHFRKKPD